MKFFKTVSLQSAPGYTSVLRPLLHSRRKPLTPAYAPPTVPAMTKRTLYRQLSAPLAVLLGLLGAVMYLSIVYGYWYVGLGLGIILIAWSVKNLRSPYYTNEIPDQPAWRELLPAGLPAVMIFGLPLLRKITGPEWMVDVVLPTLMFVAVALVANSMASRSPRRDFPPLDPAQPSEEQLALARDHAPLLAALSDLEAIDPVRIRLWGVANSTGGDVEKLATDASTLAQAGLITLSTLDAGPRKKDWLVALSAHGLGALGTLHTYDSQHTGN